MKTRYIITTLLLNLLSVTVFAQANITDQFFKDADIFLKKYIASGGVDYKAIHDNPEPLNKLVATIKTVTLAGLSKDEKMAFWINAYNLTIINSVVSKWPINSPMDVSGFFDVKKHNIAGKQLTLNDIENKQIREPYKDPRIHFALVCAAAGCPKIVPYAYMPDKLDVQLENRTKKTLNDTYFIRLKSKEKKVLISQIFDWYKKDFTGTGKSIIGYINQYRENKIPGDFTTGYYTYDWKVNFIKKKI